MNELQFTIRLEATLTRGIASVPLPALEPASARYRITAATIRRRARPRLTVAIAASGLALLAGTVGAAASGTSPSTVVTAAAHRVVMLVQGVTTGEAVPATPSPRASSRPATIAQPLVAAPGPGDGDRASQPSDSGAPGASEEPAPAPIEAQPTSQPEDTSSSPSDGPSDSPAPTL